MTEMLMNGPVSWSSNCACGEPATTLDGKQCRGCRANDRAKAYYVNNKDKIKEKAKLRYNSPEYKVKRAETPAVEKMKEKNARLKITPGSRFSNARHQAKLKEVNFDLTKSQYFMLIEMPCYYCNDKFKNKNGETGCGLDRIDNDKSKGYAVGNVLPCCGQCNMTRNAFWSVEEAKVMIESVIQYMEKKK